MQSNSSDQRISILRSDMKPKIFYRIFPEETILCDCVKFSKDRKIICIRSKNRPTTHDHRSFFWQFVTNGVFINSNQFDVYQTVTEGILTKVIEGNNAVIVSFGQTGSGKSFTINALHNTFELSGIIPRLISDLFKYKSTLQKNVLMTIQTSYVEVSKDRVTDLLKQYPHNKMEPTNVKNATKIILETESDALKMLYKGEGRKLFATNNESYLSHMGSSVLTFFIMIHNKNLMATDTIISKLHVIDLAGVDSLGNKSCAFKRSVDVGAANTIKSNFEQFIINSSNNFGSSSNVKYKLNPLINYLGDDLSPDSYLRFIGHLKLSSKQDLFICRSLLRFGQIVHNFKSISKISKLYEKNIENEIKYLKNEVERLKDEKILNAVLLDQNLLTNLNQERLDHIKRCVEEYSQNKIGEINVLNVADIKVVLEMFRDIYIQCEKEKNEAEQKTKQQSEEFLEKLQDSKDKAMNNINNKKRSIDKSSSLSHHSSLLRKKANKKNSEQSVDLKSKNKTTVKKPRKSNGTNMLTVPELTPKNGIPDSLVPEMMPEFHDAWNMFIEDPQTSFNAQMDNYRRNEIQIRNVNNNYISEFTELDRLKAIILKNKTRLAEAKMTKQCFISQDNKLAVSSDNLLDPEHLMKARLKRIENELTVQQEKVLKLLSELKMHFNTRNLIRSKLTDDFNEYCKNQFHTQVLQDENIMFGDTFNIEKDDSDDEQILNDILRNSNKLEQMAHLKRCMEKEMKLREIYDKTHKQWRNV